MTNEQFMLRLGIDNSAIGKGLRGLKSQMGSAMSGIQAQIAGAFSVGALTGFFNKVINHFDEIKDRAENLNVGTDFFQGMQRTFETTGSSAQKFGAAMDKLNIKIGEAKAGNKQAVESFQKIGITVAQLESMSVEQVFYAVSDGLKATGDNAKIAAGAVDIFGKSGASMVTILNEGSESLKKMVDAAQKLSEADVKFLAQTKDDMKNASETAMVWGGKLLALVKDVAAAYGEMSGVGFGEERTRMIRERVLEARAIEKAALIEKVNKEDAIERAKELQAVESKAASEKLAVLEKEKRIKDEQDAQDARSNERLKEANKLLGEKWKAAQKASAIGKDIQDAQRGRTDWTLGEIAGLDPSQLSGRNRWKIGQAQEVERLRNQAKWARLEGDEAGANTMLNQSDRLAKGIGALSAAEADPLGALRKSAEEQLKAMQAIGATVEGNALRMIVANSE